MIARPDAVLFKSATKARAAAEAAAPSAGMARGD